MCFRRYGRAVLLLLCREAAISLNQRCLQEGQQFREEVVVIAVGFAIHGSSQRTKLIEDDADIWMMVVGLRFHTAKLLVNLEWLAEWRFFKDKVKEITLLCEPTICLPISFHKACEHMVLKLIEIIRKIQYILPRLQVELPRNCGFESILCRPHREQDRKDHHLITMAKKFSDSPIDQPAYHDLGQNLSLCDVTSVELSECSLPGCNLGLQFQHLLLASFASLGGGRETAGREGPDRMPAEAHGTAEEIYIIDTFDTYLRTRH
mmetsp:Transcript_42001/g.91103  ORF Transcript_42001/g.91103 Transcript_42001/m.91103 type:complete len:263 (+) Transcript_42001:45-833(+)